MIGMWQEKSQEAYLPDILNVIFGNVNLKKRMLGGIIHKIDI